MTSTEKVLAAPRAEGGWNDEVAMVVGGELVGELKRVVTIGGA